ncbi:hypothetical protein CAPTEDRAFT_206463 [Capitella teleta]|uniref:Uncharacterized protein n=1 Tax=Capitella teleta TaxID=283909 RepID=R7T4M9_CAPTE|nr:hypothetical protein CAPTEDRAFT_206463 [Capitella teleta]|eukprot:ELT88012.1 hypothetical protein CAPTEDRAFT_206463 [Capitella teleta]
MTIQKRPRSRRQQKRRHSHSTQRLRGITSFTALPSSTSTPKEATIPHPPPLPSSLQLNWPAPPPRVLFDEILFPNLSLCCIQPISLPSVTSSTPLYSTPTTSVTPSTALCVIPRPLNKEHPRRFPSRAPYQEEPLSLPRVIPLPPPPPTPQEYLSVFSPCPQPPPPPLLRPRQLALQWQNSPLALPAPPLSTLHEEDQSTVEDDLMDSLTALHSEIFDLPDLNIREDCEDCIRKDRQLKALKEDLTQSEAMLAEKEQQSHLLSSQLANVQKQNQGLEKRLSELLAIEGHSRVARQQLKRHLSKDVFSSDSENSSQDPRKPKRKRLRISHDDTPLTDEYLTAQESADDIDATVAVESSVSLGSGEQPLSRNYTSSLPERFASLVDMLSSLRDHIGHTTSALSDFMKDAFNRDDFDYSAEEGYWKYPTVDMDMSEVAEELGMDVGWAPLAEGSADDIDENPVKTSEENDVDVVAFRQFCKRVFAENRQKGEWWYEMNDLDDSLFNMFCDYENGKQIEEQKIERKTTEIEKVSNKVLTEYDITVPFRHFCQRAFVEEKTIDCFDDIDGLGESLFNLFCTDEIDKDTRGIQINEDEVEDQDDFLMWDSKAFFREKCTRRRLLKRVKPSKYRKCGGMH